MLGCRRPNPGFPARSKPTLEEGIPLQTPNPTTDMEKMYEKLQKGESDDLEAEQTAEISKMQKSAGGSSASKSSPAGKSSKPRQDYSRDPHQRKKMAKLQ
mmetsp:Transcript_31705/g.49624  ORF Transcript_31705/g.49624 Transcript_31705/m.49624 type:complete len:100 (-) Transcript_31705:1156-1455(-)